MEYSPSGNIVKKQQQADIFINGSAGMIDFDYEYDYNASKPHAVEHMHDYVSTTDKVFEWDLNGNMTKINDAYTGLDRFQCWDEENRLVAVKDYEWLSEYIYDAGGERIWKLTGQVQHMLINGTTWIDVVDFNNRILYTSPYVVVDEQEYTKHYYTETERVCSKLGGGWANSLVDPQNYRVDPIVNDYETIAGNLEELLERFAECPGQDADNIIVEVTLQGVDSYFGLDDYEGDQFFYHPDHLGSSSFITDANGDAAQHLQYLPFGESFIDQRNTSWATPYTFSAKEKDLETGYSYFGARYYNPEISVWLSVDPLASAFPGISPYSYCYQNPVRFIDPTGMAGGETDRLGLFNRIGNWLTGQGFKNRANKIISKDPGIHTVIHNEDGSITAQGSSKWQINGGHGAENGVNDMTYTFSKEGYSLTVNNSQTYSESSSHFSWGNAANQGGITFSALLDGDIYRVGAAFNGLVNSASREAWTKSVNLVKIGSTEAQAQKLLSGVVRTTKYIGWAGNVVNLSVNGINTYNHWNSLDAGYYQAKAVGAGVIVGLNALNFVIPGLGTVLSLTAGAIDAAGGFDFIYDEFK